MQKLTLGRREDSASLSFEISALVVPRHEVKYVPYTTLLPHSLALDEHIPQPRCF